jgi:hypothetical protein
MRRGFKRPTIVSSARNIDNQRDRRLWIVAARHHLHTYGELTLSQFSLSHIHLVTIPLPQRTKIWPAYARNLPIRRAHIFRPAFPYLIVTHANNHAKFPAGEHKW